jgi:hypothetical protein
MSIDIKTRAVIERLVEALVPFSSEGDFHNYLSLESVNEVIAEARKLLEDDALSKPASEDAREGLWAVVRTSRWSHYDDGGSGEDKTILHVAPSKEECRAVMNSFWAAENEKQPYKERKNTLQFTADSDVATGYERGLTGGGYASHSRTYEIEHAPSLIEAAKGDGK